MMRIFNATGLLLSGSLLVSAALSQELAVPEAAYPSLPAEAASAEGFAPAGWLLESQAAGDLNGDSLADLALVLRQDDRANVIANPDGLGEDPLDTNPRILAVAFATGEPIGYRLALENHTLIPRRVVATFGDPLAETGGLGIERGVLRVALDFFASAGSWTTSTTTYRFRHQHGRFELIGFDRDTTARNSGETEGISINFLTRRMKRTSGNIQSDETEVSWADIPERPLLTIEAIGDGIEFEPPL